MALWCSPRAPPPLLAGAGVAGWLPGRRPHQVGWAGLCQRKWGLLGALEDARSSPRRGSLRIICMTPGVDLAPLLRRWVSR